MSAAELAEVGDVVLSGRSGKVQWVVTRIFQFPGGTNDYVDLARLEADGSASQYSRTSRLRTEAIVIKPAGT